MQYQEFLEKCLYMLKEQLGEGYNIQLNSILKNNSITLDGVVILKNDAKITPNIYLEEYFAQYEQGVEMETIISCIIGVYHDKVMERGDFEIQFTFEKMKENIIFRIINLEKNKELLCHCPHLEFLDFAITFHCLVQDQIDSIGTIRITDEHLNAWNITTTQLYECAKKNTPRLLPPLLRNMEEVLREILQQEELSLDVNQIHMELNRFDEESRIPDRRNRDMYILSNTKGINGASCMLYPDVIQNFSRLLKCDIYILPSSIHEIILLPAVEEYEKTQLEEMVTEINQTQVPYEEILSNHVYFYSNLENQIYLL